MSDQLTSESDVSIVAKSSELAKQEPADSADHKDVLASAKRWVHAHPAASVFIALGAGLITGQAVSALFRDDPPEPPSMRDRLHRGASAIAARAADLADDTGDQVSRAVYQTREHTGHALDRLGRAMTSTQDVGLEWLSRVGDAVQQGVVRGVSKRISDIIERAYTRSN